MELTVTNRSQAYPKAEKGGCRQEGVERSTKWSGTRMTGSRALRSKGIEKTEFLRYPAFVNSKQSVGLNKSKKDLQKLIGCSIMLYVVLKVH